MKKNWKRTLVLTGVVGALAVSVAGAAAVRHSITAELRPDITVELNGSAQALTDANGNPVYPIIYNNSTYLPVRAVGELSGMSVNWDNATQTVEMNDGAATTGTNTSGTTAGTTGTTTGTGTGTTTGTTTTQSYIGEAKAKEIALSDAGLTASGVSFIRVQMDWDNGRPEYDVEFYSGNKEYDYDIDAYTGQIRSRDFDVENFVIPSTGTNTSTSTTDIGAEAAKSAALKHAGVSASAATFVKVQQDWENGQRVYEVEFYSNGKEYDYEIAASNGQVLSFDYDAEYYTPSTTTSSGQTITAEKAKSIALQHAGLSASQVTFIKAQLDWDDGRQEYEVEFRQGRVEYDYTIDATTGTILEADRDWD